MESVSAQAETKAGGNDSDPITRPAHYTCFAIEPREAIAAWGLNFALGNVVKYVARADHKGHAIEDLKKARENLDYEIRKREEMLLREAAHG